MLDADATNALALNGLKKVAEAEVAQARDAIAAGNAELANQRIAELTKISPNHPAIPELRAAIAKTREADGQALEQLLSKGEAQLRAGKFTGGGDSALAVFQSVLKRDPNNARAKSGLRKVAQSFVTRANAMLDDANTAGSEKLLQQAEAIAPDLPELHAVQSRQRETREQADIAAAHSEVAPADQTRIQGLLDEAEKSVAAGNLIVPPGDSAYDKYRAVLRVDGNNAKAMAGLARIPARARELFEQAVKDGTPNKARSYLDAISEIDPGDASVAPLRERLANMFLDQAEAKIAQSLRADATRALKSARELSPNNPRLPALDAKLRELPEPSG